MSPPARNTCTIFVVALATIVHITRFARADDVADYLERLEIQRLLIVHLESQLEHNELSQSQREEVMLRLAALYASTLEAQPTGADRNETADRARDLRTKLPEESRDELELALVRGEYIAYEQSAERHRLRLATEAELAAAKDGLPDVIQQLDGLRKRLESRAGAADRRVGRTSGRAAIAADEQSEKLRALLDHATFLNAWALYYQSWLNDRSENARAAEPLFAFVLQMEESFPDANDVSVDLRASEPYARAILGMALCKTLTSNRETAIEWIDLLRHENTIESLRSQADAWKSYVFMTFGAFDEAAALYDAARADGNEVPPAWMRLLAVHALEASSTHRRAAEIARRAVADLAASGELRQVLDIAERYGVQSLGNTGFAMRYVQGVMDYERARQDHAGERPTIDSSIVAQYESAAGHLLAAHDEPDASSYADARASTIRLAAMCRYYQSRFLDARALFEQAAATLPNEQAEEALWMAIVCLEVVAKEGVGGGGRDLNAQLASLIERFLAAYPSSSHAPTLVLRRISDQKPSLAAVQSLLAIPQKSEAFEAARQHASEMLFQLYREAGESERASIGAEYLALALPLHVEREAAAMTDIAVGADSYLRLSRQILEVALSRPVSRLAAAIQVLASVDRLAAQHGLNIDPVRTEVDFRRVQLRLLESDVTLAAAIANRMWETDPQDSWTRYAVRAMFRDGVERSRAARQRQTHDAQALSDQVTFGERLISEYADQQDALQKPEIMGYYALVASAYMESHTRSGNSTHGRRALELYEALLAQRERNREFLRAAALLCEAIGQSQRALDHWRLLVAGSDVATDPWFEAKLHLIQLLSRLDPVKAREVMDQHTLLHPDYGPDPWGTRLRQLDDRMRRTETAPISQDPPAEAAPA